ncbi:FAD/NAD(P)-binding domain-containing protein [Rhizodiscina lignyota]|uniref:FAD/NAD(P)-binding domain-containing protein n=1 Tax=Rhizodiscina lignyota TaxID=1504668 RepID=A0A9P4IK89_9PEZI|nr:FAD/NAD(P)-binding domain-containing protein [Rhizodiscina lignyota]
MSRLASLPCSLPTALIDQSIDAKQAASSFGPRLNNLSEDDFSEDATWRDVFALTGTARTFFSAPSILTAWHETCKLAAARAFEINADSAQVVRLPKGASWLQCMFTFEITATPASSCDGIICLTPGPDGIWKIWSLRTILGQLKGGHGNVDMLEPDTASNQAEGSLETGHFDCVVIGAGHSGLSVAGRLKALGVSCVVFDKNKEVGDSWKLRYKSTRLHTIREYSHLPFDRTYPQDRYQELLTKDELARGYQDWVSKYAVNVWMSTKLMSGSWDAKDALWTLEYERKGHRDTIRCSYLVLAVGSGCQIPVYPSIANMESFKGAMMHSVDYYDASVWEGKRGIVIGSANTGHDVAKDMVEARLASVTMVQRSRTYVMPYEYYSRIQERTYNPSFSTELADMLSLSTAFPITRLMALVGVNSQAEQEPERFDALERAGFKLERYGDIIHHLYERSGKHYLDVGASAMISQGLIKMKSDALATRFTESGLQFDNDDVLPADVVVFATGFEGNLRKVVRELLGAEVADAIDDFWGVDEEGELRGSYRPCGHPALYLHGGSLGIMRYYSRFIALQIKAALLGTPLRAYTRKFPIKAIYGKAMNGNGNVSDATTMNGSI